MTAALNLARESNPGMRRSRPAVSWLIAVVLFVLAPLLLGSYAQYVVTMWLIFAIAAVGLNIPIGLGNLYSFGHGAFMLIGAYGTGVAMTHWGWGPLPACVFAVALAGISGAVIGLPSLRLASFSLAIVTFAFGDMLFHVVKGFDFTGAAQGIFMPPLAASAWLGGRFFYYLVGVLFAIAMLAAYSLSTSKTGRALRIVGASEIVAQSLGINLLRYKILAFTASALYGACAGCLMALVTTYVAPDTYSPDMSISVFAAVMIGGVGTLMGPVWGALFVVLIPELTQSISGLSLVVYAVLFTVVVTVYPGGIVGGWTAFMRSRAARRQRNRDAAKAGREPGHD